MLSTMQDEPLSFATLLEYGTTFHGGSKVATWTGTGIREMSYAQLGVECARLAHALAGLGVGESDRVATFMWNDDFVVG